MDITLNYFELFQLSVSCEIDSRQLALRYKALHRAIHPDRYAADNTDQHQRLSLQYAAYVNEAYDTLKTPLRRFIYLLELAGRPVDMECNTSMEPDFLMEQMALRESIAELKMMAKPTEQLQYLMSQINDKLSVLSAEFTQLWHKNQFELLDQAERVVRKMQFMVKLTAELEQIESNLLD
ncbi:MAG: Fe-S protein assembly co-chaperone HscB [Endozoicomonas sp. (ex Botrylloides leachii)]|nr:Fe-S protein assembly co-chaperone HscB [Endozoicomonas sp. (ex Botrylloides leachii)]